MIMMWSLPEWGGKSRAGGEVGELGANATEEQAGQAVAVDDGKAGGCHPSDKTKSNDG